MRAARASRIESCHAVRDRVTRSCFVVSRPSRGFVTWLCSRRDEHRERIAGLARADADLHAGRARPPPASASAPSSSNPRRRSPSLARTHSSPCARRSSTSTRPPGAVMRAASATARAGSGAWCSACESSATSTAPSRIGSFSSSPRFQMTFETRRRRARPRARLQHDLGPVDRDDARRPPRRLHRQVAFAAAEVGDLERRQQQAERARPGRPAPPGHELPRVARVGSGVRLEVLLAQRAAPPAAARRRRAPAGRRPPARTAPPSSAHSAVARRAARDGSR